MRRYILPGFVQYCSWWWIWRPENQHPLSFSFFCLFIIKSRLCGHLTLPIRSIMTLFVVVPVPIRIYARKSSSCEKKTRFFGTRSEWTSERDSLNRSQITLPIASHPVWFHFSDHRRGFEWNKHIWLCVVSDKREMKKTWWNTMTLGSAAPSVTTPPPSNVSCDSDNMAEAPGWATQLVLGLGCVSEVSQVCPTLSVEADISGKTVEILNIRSFIFLVLIIKAVIHALVYFSSKFPASQIYYH